MISRRHYARTGLTKKLDGENEVIKEGEKVIRGKTSQKIYEWQVWRVGIEKTQVITSSLLDGKFMK